MKLYCYTIVCYYYYFIYINDETMEDDAKKESHGRRELPILRPIVVTAAYANSRLIIIIIVDISPMLLFVSYQSFQCFFSLSLFKWMMNKYPSTICTQLTIYGCCC